MEVRLKRPADGSTVCALKGTSESSACCRTEWLESESSKQDRHVPGRLPQPDLAPFAHMPKTSATLLIIDDDEVVRAERGEFERDAAADAARRAGAECNGGGCHVHDPATEPPPP